MKLKNIFRLPYGYVEEKSFESKETQIDEKFDENSEINLRQDEKDKEHDQAVENLIERDKGHDQAVLDLMEKDSRFDQAIINLINSDEALGQKINSLNDKVDLINNNGNNNGSEINDLKAKDLEHNQAINDLKAKDLEHDQAINDLKDKDNAHGQAIINLINTDKELNKAIVNLIDTDANLSQRVNNKLDTKTYNNEKLLFALKTDIPSIEGLAKESTVNDSLALKADKTEIFDMATKEWVNGQNFLTAHQDISSKADKTYVDENLALKANQENLNTLNTLVGKVSNTLKAQIETETAERKENDKDVVKTTAIPSEDMPNRKAIVMENNDALMGKSSSGKVNIAMVSKYDVADFGSKAVHCNLNGKYPRPTYNDNQPIAIAEDILNAQDAVKAQFDMLLSKINQLEDKLSKVDEQGAIKVEPKGENVLENNGNRNFVVSGEFSNDIDVSGKDVIVKDIITSAGQNHKFASNNGEITIKNCNYSGDHSRAEKGNVEIGIQSNDIVNIRDCQFNTNTYNQLEVSLNGAYTAKGVNINNCNFGGKKSNNAISIFGLKDNAVINISNCVFDDVSNPLRISNHSNAKNVVINIIDCKVNKWESNLDYHGFICFQDYTSRSVEAESANKQFSTMTVNFINLITPEGKLLPVKDQKEICGSKDNKQLVYVYYDKTGLIPYSQDVYPTVNVK